MIAELRSYVIRPDQIDAFLDAYTGTGLPMQTQYLGRLIGWFRTEVGRPNEVTSLWEYVSFEDRLERRARLSGAPGWATYLERVTPLIVSMENRILSPGAQDN